MNSLKYSRLPTSSPGPEFTALDGPSYYSYEIERKKYGSAFSYSGTSSGAENSQLSVAVAPQSILCRICSAVVTAVCYVACILTLPISACFVLRSIQSYERIVLFRLGLLSASLGPGYVIVLPCIDTWTRVDLRTKAFSVPPQKVITADGATIEIGADVYFRVCDAVLSVTNIQDLNYSTRVICQTSLQKHIAKKNLGDIENDRQTITNSLQVDVNQMTQTWGVEVGKVELSAVKVISQPNPEFGHGSDNPLSVLGQALFPAGSTNAPMEQLQQFYRLGVQAMSKAQSAGGETRSNSVSVTPGERKPVSVSVTSDRLMSAIKPVVNSQLVVEFSCVYKFVVMDELHAVHIYHLDLKHGEGCVGVGDPVTGPADATLSLTVKLLQDLLTQRVSAFDAYMAGQLTISGDLKAAMRLGQLFEMVNHAAVLQAP